MKLVNLFAKNKTLSVSIFIMSLLFVKGVDAAVLLPGDINSCGELATAGTYTLTADVDGGSNACFTVSANGVVIDGGQGAGYTISGTGDVAIDARARDAGPGSSLTDGESSYTNLQINNITISGYTIGINVSGNDSASSFGGDGGAVEIFYSIVGSITADGGGTTAQAYGGLGGNISFTDTDLDISDSDFSTLGGTGTTGDATHGIIDIDYSGNVTKSDVTFRKMRYFYINDDSYNYYPGGTWPVTETSITSCSTLYATTPTTFTLSNDISDLTDTCFWIASDDITIDGAGYTITATSSPSTYAVTVSYGDYDNLTLEDLHISGYSNAIDSTQSVTINSATTVDLSNATTTASNELTVNASSTIDFSGSLITADDIIIDGSSDLDISNSTTTADTLSLDYSGTFSYTGAYVSDLSLFTVAGFSYLDSYSAGLISDFEQVVGENFNSYGVEEGWTGVAMTPDGNKIVALDYGGQIHISNDGGLNWTITGDNEGWESVAMTPDGDKIAVVDRGGQIHISTDGGINWTAYGASENWYGIAMTPDGNKIVALDYGGQIHISTDGGLNWKAYGPSESWQAISMTPDGKKLAAIDRGGQIHISTDGGINWTAYGASENWYGIAMTPDGNKIVALDYGGQIHISTDGGFNWSLKESNRNWSKVSMSDNGEILVAGVYSGQHYVSTDGGDNWTAYGPSEQWNGIAMTPDGNKLVSNDLNGNIYISLKFARSLSVDIMSPSGIGTVNYFNPSVSWGSSVDCYYSYDDFVSTSTATCSNNGTDIEKPDSNGTSTLYIKGIDANQTVATSSREFNFQQEDILITAPISGESYGQSNFSPVVDFDSTGDLTLTACYSSYDNFSSTTTLDCANNGSDIPIPTNNGKSTLYLKAVDDGANVYTDSVTFNYNFSLIKTGAPNETWWSIASDTIGQYLAAVDRGGYIYTSDDYGVSWTQQTGSGSRQWYDIVSDETGQYLLAAEYANNGYLYTSDDYGVTWTPRTSAGAKYWEHVSSDDSGQYLVAKRGDFTWDGYSYSSDYGETWNITSLIYRAISSPDSSSSGQYVYAVAKDWLLRSTNFGASYGGISSYGDNSTSAIATDSTGQYPVRVRTSVDPGIFFSSDYGVSWTKNTNTSPVNNYLDVDSDDSGQVIAALDSGNQIHYTQDRGNTWSLIGSNSNWRNVKITDNGDYMYVTDSSFIYKYDPNAAQDTLNITIDEPDPNESKTTDTWDPAVDWPAVADGCYSSYDNFSSTTTLDCTLGGTDIPEPTATGTQILYVKAIAENANDGNASVTFTFADSAGDGEESSWVDAGLDVYGRSLAMSADGEYIYLGYSGGGGGTGPIYKSDDGGSTWSSTGDVAGYGIETSFSGEYVLVASSNGQPQLSDDYGETYSPVLTSRDWRDSAVSASGQHMALVARGHADVYLSDDYGSTWATTTISGASNLFGIDMSSDGKYLIASNWGGYIYTSDDFGVTWNEVTDEGTANWWAVSISGDGSKMVASYGQGDGALHVSEDYGATWTATTLEDDIRAVDSSIDGETIVAVGSSFWGSTPVFISKDGGDNWIESGSTLGYFSAAVSADGTKYVVNDFSSQKTYTYTESPRTLSVAAVAPSGTITEFSPLVSWSSAETCEYSYDDSTYTEVTCSSNGSDIAAPTSAGSATLYVRGTDGDSNQDTASTIFNLTGYYFCGTTDSDWGNNDNWYSDDACSVSTTAPGSTGNVAFVIETTSPVIEDADSPLPLNIITTGMTGSAADVGVIFSENVAYSGTVTGNATFNDSSYHTGTINGNVTYNTDHYNSAVPTGGTLTIGSGVTYQGQVTGTMYDSSSTEITSVVFNGSSNNAGVINIDTTFNNTSAFTLGTINATATLNGNNQIIQGINTVTNFFKELVSGATTLWFDTSAVLNVSNLFTLKGADENNLLSIRSLIPGTSFDFGINGTADFDYLRIFDTNNTGSSLDLSTKTVINGGGNTGFTFPSASDSGSYSFVSSPPVLPVSRGGESQSSSSGPSSSSNSSSGSGGFVYNAPGTLDFDTIEEFRPFGEGSFNPGQAGATVIPNPFEGFNAPGAIEFIQLPANFRLSLERFVFEEPPEELESLLSSNALQNSLAGISFSSAQQLANLVSRPRTIESVDLETDEDIFAVFDSNGNQKTTKISYKNGSLVQAVRSYPNEDLNLQINIDSEEQVIFTYEGVSVSYSKDGIRYSLDVRTQKPGRYTLSSNSSAVKLLIEVVPPPESQETKKPWGIFNWLYNLIT